MTATSRPTTRPGIRATRNLPAPAGPQESVR